MLPRLSDPALTREDDGSWGLLGSFYVRCEGEKRRLVVDGGVGGGNKIYGEGAVPIPRGFAWKDLVSMKKKIILNYSTVRIKADIIGFDTKVWLSLIHI